MVEIARADLTDPIHADALINLMSEYASDPMGGGNGLSEYVKSNLVSDLMGRTDTSVILAFREDQAIGLVTCIEGFSTFACKPLLNVHDAIIKTAYRGQGIINMLLREAENIAIEKGCCKMTLEVLQGNEHAQSAYSKFGFCAYQLAPEMGKALFWEKRL